MGIQNLVVLLKVLNYFFLKFWAVKICGFQICSYPKHVGTQKCGYNEISNFVGTQNWWQLQLFYPFRIKFMKIAAHAHMNDLSIINLVLS